jgi:hypothetical protein
MLITVAQSALLVLNRSDAWHALCGGLAVGVHGHPRATRDIDVWFAGASDAERGIRALLAAGWTAMAQDLPLPEGMHIRRCLAPQGGIVLDGLVPPPGWTLTRERSDLDGCACWVLDRASLVRLKRWSGRPQDLADVAALEAAP